LWGCRQIEKWVTRVQFPDGELLLFVLLVLVLLLFGRLWLVQLSFNSSFLSFDVHAPHSHTRPPDHQVQYIHVAQHGVISTRQSVNGKRQTPNGRTR
jgi:hypothetical protein